MKIIACLICQNILNLQQKSLISLKSLILIKEVILDKQFPEYINDKVNLLECCKLDQYHPRVAHVLKLQKTLKIQKKLKIYANNMISDEIYK